MLLQIAHRAQQLGILLQEPTNLVVARLGLLLSLRLLLYRLLLSLDCRLRLLLLACSSGVLTG
jgi:hypothetical protein